MTNIGKDLKRLTSDESLWIEVTLRGCSCGMDKSGRFYLGSLYQDVENEEKNSKMKYVTKLKTVDNFSFVKYMNKYNCRLVIFVHDKRNFHNV